MSLYYLQKFLYQLNRDQRVQARFGDDLDALLGEFELTEEETRAIEEPDVGLLYVLGVNGADTHALWPRFVVSPGTSTFRPCVMA